MENQKRHDIAERMCETTNMSTIYLLADKIFEDSYKYAFSNREEVEKIVEIFSEHYIVELELNTKLRLQKQWRVFLYKDTRTPFVERCSVIHEENDTITEYLGHYTAIVFADTEAEALTKAKGKQNESPTNN